MKVRPEKGNFTPIHITLETPAEVAILRELIGPTSIKSRTEMAEKYGLDAGGSGWAFNGLFGELTGALRGHVPNGDAL